MDLNLKTYSEDEIIEIRSQLRKISTSQRKMLHSRFNKIWPGMKKLDSVLNKATENPDEAITIFIDIFGINQSITITDDFIAKTMDILPMLAGAGVGYNLYKYWDDLNNPRTISAFRTAIYFLISSIISLIMTLYEKYFFNNYPDIRKATKDYLRKRSEQIKEVFRFFPDHPLKFIKSLFNNYLIGYWEMWEWQYKIIKKDETKTYCILFWANMLVNIATVYYGIKTLSDYVKGKI